jgi:hypothetical protein
MFNVYILPQYFNFPLLFIFIYFKPYATVFSMLYIFSILYILYHSYFIEHHVIITSFNVLFYMICYRY